MRAPRAALAAAWCLATVAACCATIAACSSTRTATGPLANKQVGVGLELQRWFVPIDPEARRDGLAKAVDEGLATAVDTRLRSSGFSIYRVRMEKIPAFAAALGGSPQVQRELLGNVTSWSEVEWSRVEDGATVIVSGKPARTGDTIYRLALRGWSFPTVDSARARVELRICRDSSTGTRAVLDATAGTTRLEDVGDGRETVEIAPDEALVVLETPVLASRSSRGAGAEMQGPPTVAALLFAENRIKTKASVLVVTAGFEDMLPVPAAKQPPAR